MLAKNKKFFSDPFKVAISSVSFIAFLFISFGLNGWGTPAGNEQAIGEVSRWCERVSDGFFREPSNTLGNLGFVVTGLYMFCLLYTSPSPRDRTRSRMPSSA